MKDEDIVICKHCNGEEYWGKMINQNGEQYCRMCYIDVFESNHNQAYTWHDLNGTMPDGREINIQ